VLVVVAAIGHFTAARVEAAPPPGHQDIQDSVGAVQTTVNGIGTNVNAVQTTVSGIGTKVDAVQTTVNGIGTNVNAVQTTVSGIGINVNDIKATLDRLPPAWNQILSAALRFRLVMGGTAVLDRETGLVWEQSPSLAQTSWSGAHIHCNIKTVGGRKGWRLPTIQELASLVDPTQSTLALPAGHPFGNVMSWFYWSASTGANTGNAWDVDFEDGDVGGYSKGDLYHFVWCVRGGQGVDPQ
jgi:hypothetical protein